ncbi:hypothetical protein F2Q69_00058152 [Brassica cretica]|uniref:Uncharacterized protein n=1 Tax=Brassica cretica TaxID=69181 RepID=A0A8S9RLK2_BRACR|nr:hypothetical protein F2Q69_00058152 [Brassica cretica]
MQSTSFSMWVKSIRRRCQPIIIDNVLLCCYCCSNSVSSSTFDDLCLGLTSQVVVGWILRFWDSRNLKKNVEFVGVKPRLMESKIETLNLTLIEERLKLIRPKLGKDHSIGLKGYELAKREN